MHATIQRQNQRILKKEKKELQRESENFFFYLGGG